MSMSRTILFVCGVLAFSMPLARPCTAIAQITPAEKLVTAAPDDVLGLIATSGGDSVKSAFEKTILGRLWSDPGMQRFVGSLEQALLAKITQEIDDPDATRAIELVRGLARLVVSRPIVAGVAQKEAQGGPPVYGFIMLDAGPRKSDIASALAKLEALAGEGDIVDVQVGSLTMHGPQNPGDVPGYWGWIGDHLVFAINDGTGLAVKYLQSSSRTTPDYLRKVPGNGDAVVIHINRQKAINVVGDMARMEGAEEEFGAIQAVMRELGLSDLKSVTARMGFDGPDMVSDAFLEVAQPHTGLLANFKTIDLTMFDAVDAGAMAATAFNCDVAGLYDTVMKAVEAVLGDEFTEVDEAIAKIETELKIKIRDGLLESLDGRMVFYSVPGGPASGSPQGAFALLATLKDAKLWEETLTALGQFATARSEGMVQISSQDHEGKTMHTWTIAPLAMLHLMPSWCVADGRVVIGSNPTFLRSAVDKLVSGDKSIRSTEGFRKVTAKLPGNLISLKYSDSKLQFNQMMMGVQQFWPMVTMGAMQAGLQLPAVLPNLSPIAEHMEPSCQYAWFEAEGIRSHYRGTGIEPGLGAAAGAGVGLGIMMPALARARQQARRVASMSNLKQLGLALIMYADDRGAFPERLEQARDYYRDSRILESPLKPNDFDGPSYIYVAGLNRSMDPDTVLVYENPAFGPKGINVLFMDAHVEWMEPDDFRRAIEATYKQLGREAPEIRFANP